MIIKLSVEYTRAALVLKRVTTPIECSTACPIIDVFLRGVRLYIMGNKRIEALLLTCLIKLTLASNYVENRWVDNFCVGKIHGYV